MIGAFAWPFRCGPLSHVAPMLALLMDHHKFTQLLTQDCIRMNSISEPGSCWPACATLTVHQAENNSRAHCLQIPDTNTLSPRLRFTSSDDKKGVEKGKKVPIVY